MGLKTSKNLSKTKQLRKTKLKVKTEYFYQSDKKMDHLLSKVERTDRWSKSPKDLVFVIHKYSNPDT